MLVTMYLSCENEGKTRKKREKRKKKEKEIRNTQTKRSEEGEWRWPALTHSSSEVKRIRKRGKNN